MPDQYKSGLTPGQLWPLACTVMVFLVILGWCVSSMASCNSQAPPAESREA